jgi:hypothetical protein
MKKIFRLNLLLAAITTLIFASCEEKVETPTEEKSQTEIEVEAALNADYSNKTAEEAKQDVENEAIKLVNEIDLLEDDESIDVMMNLADLLGGDNNAQPIAGEYNIPLKAAQTIADDSKSATDVYSVLKAASAGRVALKDSFNTHIAATYTYNFTTQEFDETPNNDALVIKFPGKESDLTNTAEIFVGNLTVQNITTPHAEIANEVSSIELPTGLTATLKYNNNVLINYSLTASYMSDGVPTLLKNELTIGQFSFVEELTNTDNKDASFDFSFKKGDNVLIGFGASVEGDWTASNIDAQKYEEAYTYYDYIWNPDTYNYEMVEVTDSYEEVYMEEILQKSNAYITIMNLKAVGTANIKAIVDAEQAFDAAHEADRDEYGDYPENIEEQETDAMVAAISQNSRFALVYGTENTLIASLEPYKAENTYTYEYYDWETDQIIQYTETESDLDFRMVFKDGSPVAMETYIDTELDGFFTALEDFGSKMDATYGSSSNY